MGFDQEALDRINATAKAIADAFSNAATVTAPPRKPVGERMREMEWQERTLRAEVAARDDTIAQLQTDLVDMTESRDYWQDRRRNEIDAQEELAQQKLTTAEFRKANERLHTDLTDAWQELTALQTAWGELVSLLTFGPGTVVLDEDDNLEVLETIRDLQASVTTDQETIATLRTHLTAASEENERLRRELTDLRNTHHEWVNGQHPKQPTLSESIQRINDVVTMQIETMSPTSGTGRTVDIRRRQLAKYPISHDVEHLTDGTLGQAIRALVNLNRREWPWSQEMWQDILESGDAYCHAAALLIAKHDATREAGQES